MRNDANQRIDLRRFLIVRRIPHKNTMLRCLTGELLELPADSVLRAVVIAVRCVEAQISLLCGPRAADGGLPGQSIDAVAVRGEASG